MILPSENAVGRNNLLGMPERLLNNSLGKKNAIRLEFHAIDRAVTESEQDGTSFATAAEARLEEQIAELKTRLELQAQQMESQIVSAKREASAEARQRWEEELEERVAGERAQVVRTCEEFAKERARYFAGVEAEVIKLALAIATRVLHRETKLDPMLLTAAVRVALEKVADNSTTMLRVPAAEIEKWREVILSREKLEVQLIGDEGLDAGECILETNVGRVELGVSAQLEEIEKGFFDLLRQRPA